MDDLETLAVMRLFDGIYPLHDRHAVGLIRPHRRTRARAREDAIGSLGRVSPTWPGSSGSVALPTGASFEFFRATTLISHRRAEWLSFHERILELADQRGPARRILPDHRHSTGRHRTPSRGHAARPAYRATCGAERIGYSPSDSGGVHPKGWYCGLKRQLR